MIGIRLIPLSCIYPLVFLQMTEFLQVNQLLYQYEKGVKNLIEVTCSADFLVLTRVISNNRDIPQCSTCFQIYPSGNKYNLQFLPLNNIDYGQDQSFHVNLECRHQDGTVEKFVTVFVSVEPNVAPHFTRFYVQEYRTRSALSQSGLSISSHCVDHNVGNGDILTFTLKSSQSSFFTLTGDGVIRSTVSAQDLQAECRSDVTFTILCQDRQGSRADGQLTVRLTITDGNKVPILTNLNKAVNVPEATTNSDTNGQIVTQFTVQEGGASPVCILSAVPSASLQYFELQVGGTQRQITVRGQLNYEQPSTRFTNLTVTCSDGYCTSSTAYLYVRITDVNEPIRLFPPQLAVSTYEGLIFFDPNWSTIDEDDNDDPTYTIVGGNDTGYFAVHPTIGHIISTLEYDVDQGAMPAVVNLVIQAEDEGANTVTAEVTLTILDSNDNRPQFVADNNANQSGSAIQSLNITISNCNTTIGTTVTTVTAIDLDSSFQGNNVVAYNSTIREPFIVNDDGEIVVASELTTAATYIVKITASDSGLMPGPLSSVPSLSVEVVVTTCPINTTTTLAPTATTAATTSSPPPIKNAETSMKENSWWVVTAGMLALMLLTGVFFMLWRYCSPWCNAGVPSTLWGDLFQPRAVPIKIHPATGYLDDDRIDRPVTDVTPTPTPVSE